MARKRVESPGLFDLPPTAVVMPVVATLETLPESVPVPTTAPESEALPAPEPPPDEAQSLAMDLTHWYGQESARFVRSMPLAQSLSREMQPGERVVAFRPFGHSWFGAVIGKTPLGFPYVRYRTVDEDDRPAAFDVIISDHGRRECGLSSGYRR